MYYVYVAIFGALGAAARYWISVTFDAGLFPYNTLFVNIIGCFLLAVIFRYLASFSILSKTLITGLGTGLIGSFTTFSTLSVQTADFILKEQYLFAGLYILASFIGGFLAAGLGVYISNKLIAGRMGQDD